MVQDAQWARYRELDHDGDCCASASGQKLQQEYCTWRHLTPCNTYTELLTARATRSWAQLGQ